jgi:hypothetical protein
MTRRHLLGLTVPLLVVGWLLAIACSEPPSMPPPETNSDAQVHIIGGGAGGGGGGGGEASTNSCVAVGGVCMVPGPGNICPTQISNSCGSSSDSDESGTSVEVCCAGFNDASTPDAPSDAPRDVIVDVFGGS